MASKTRATQRQAKRKKASPKESAPATPATPVAPPLPTGSTRRIRSVAISVDIEETDARGILTNRAHPTAQGRPVTIPLFESEFPPGFEDLLFAKLGIDKE